MSRHSIRLLLPLLCLLLGACALPQPVLVPAGERPFKFETDTFTFKNELEWQYRDGKPEPGSRNDNADYTLRCFVLSRSARQFYQFARFEPTQPRLDDAGYRQRIRQVVEHDPSERTPPARRVVIPGYADLRGFSAEHTDLLKDEMGTAYQSYLQRGNWRMVLPFSMRHQQATADSLLEEIRVDRPPVVHLSDFPKLEINHAVLLFAARDDAQETDFDVYDPNDPAQPTTLIFDKGSGSFRFARREYFTGGPVRVYEVYRSAFY